MRNLYEQCLKLTQFAAMEFEEIFQFSQERLKQALETELIENGYAVRKQRGFLYAEGTVPVLLVAALIEYRVVAARAIQLHDIIDVRFDSGLCKGTCPVSAGFLILTEQNVTMTALDQTQDHIHARPVIAANSLR